jgi:hypothetical protein
MHPDEGRSLDIEGSTRKVKRTFMSRARLSHRPSRSNPLQS